MLLMPLVPHTNHMTNQHPITPPTELVSKMTDLSPAADAVEAAAYKAWVTKDDSRSIAISTLRALADQAGSMKHWHVDQILSLIPT